MISKVQVTINGQTYNLTNSSGNTWTATLTAPGSTSYNQPNGKYAVTVEATNTAGTSAVAGAYLQVKETIAPVITIISPTDGARVTNNRQPVVFTVVDEAGGSGVNIGSLVVKQDGTTVTQGIVSTAITNGYRVTYTPAAALDDGNHTVTIDCSDNDGNAATAKSTSYVIDTVPPVLNVTSPEDNSITNSPYCAVAGTTNDSTSSPVTLTVNGEAVTVGTGGAFSTTVELTEGENTITVVATDSAGKSSTVVRTVTLDTSKPDITSIKIEPNPVNAGASMIVTVVVEG